jgi:2-dehydropantoate 2-reductase
MMKQILMVGAGSVGGFFGAHLAKASSSVCFLLRPKTLAAVKQNGLTVRSAKGSFTVHPSAASDPRDLPKPDLIILSVKAYDLNEVMNQIEPVLTDQTVILTLQNGVDTEDRILARFQRDCVVGGVAFIYSKIAAPGVIDHYKKGAVSIGELMGHQSPRLLAIADLFKQAGIPCQLTDDVRRSKWEKMCWNCVFNPLTVMIDDKVAKALDHPEMLRVIHQVVGEVVAVAAAVKVPLPADMAEKVVRWTQEIRDIHTSMYDDWKAGRPTEIDFHGAGSDRCRCRADRWSSRPASFARSCCNCGVAGGTSARYFDGHAHHEGQRDSHKSLAGCASLGDPGRSCDSTFGRRKVFSLSHTCASFGVGDSGV